MRPERTEDFKLKTDALMNILVDDSRKYRLEAQKNLTNNKPQQAIPLLKQGFLLLDHAVDLAIANRHIP